MQVVILCGGQGTRLREETEYRPKPMVPIGGRPILWHIMKTYAHHGHKDFILCLGYKGEIIKDFFRNYLWQTSDVTMKLGRESEVKYHTHHDEEDWTVTLLDTGPAILMTSVTMSAGFLLLTGSQFQILVLVGVMTVVSAAAAVAADLFLLPSLLTLTQANEKTPTQ